MSFVSSNIILFYRLPASVDMTDLEKSLSQTYRTGGQTGSGGGYGSDGGDSDLLMMRSEMNYNSTVYEGLETLF